MKDYMELALRLAKKSDPFPNPRVGAALVKEGKIIGMGYHKKAGLPHAEIEAIKQAGKEAAGATLYVTLEPCSHTNKRTPPCTEAIIKSGISRVVFAMEDPNPLVMGQEALKNARISVTGPTDHRKAVKLNKRYLDNMKKKPFIAIKMAMSADGKTATRTGDSMWISCKKSREMVHGMRSEFDAVMVGAGTVKQDNPQLTSRIGGGHNPWRVIIDGDFCISADSKVFRHKDRKTIIVTTEKAPKRKIDIVRRLAHVFVLGKKKVDLKQLAQVLGFMGIKKILIEGGSSLNAAALEAGMVDKLYLFVAPKVIGGTQAKGVIGGTGIDKISDAIRLKNMKTRKVGEDLLLEFDVLKRE